MKLSELIDGLNYKEIIGNIDVDIKNITFDSRETSKGCLFVCLTGEKSDGHDFCKYAEQYGAVAIVCERKVDCGITQILVDDSRSALAVFCEKFYSNAHKKLKIIGVSGTNGKTTTTFLIKHILEGFGVKCGLIGTLGVFYDGEEYESALTTPDPTYLNKIFYDMAQKGVSVVVMEVSAHAIALKKIEGIEFETGIFTNLSQDHLDYFGSMDEYAKVKKSFFDSRCKNIIVNADDKTGIDIIKANPGSITYGIESPSNVFATNIDEHMRGTDYIINIFDKIYEIESNLQGKYNIYNSLATATCCYALGVPSQKIAERLNTFCGVGGRLERVESDKCRIYVDYAHTPDALKNVLLTLEKTCEGRLICVFGCGGNRDKGKRVLMGEIVGEYADFSVVTSDNPRYEEPLDIMFEIEKGILRKSKKYVLITDRKSAIDYALNIAKKEDVILVAGKGNEKYQEILGIKHVYNDKDTIKELLR